MLTQIPSKVLTRLMVISLLIQSGFYFYSGEETVEQAEQLLAGLGGAENITEAEPCTTCLRVAVKDPLKVDEEVLTTCGAFGIVKIDHTIQVVVGPVADELAADMEKLR